MKKVTVQSDFSQFQCLPEPIYDPALATNPDQVDQLSQLIVTHYKQSMKGWTTADFDRSYQSYQSMIDAAIMAKNVVGLETLWQGIYFHDRANPNFEADVYTAVRHANVATIQHALYGYMNYQTVNFKEHLDYSKLTQLATDNADPNVLRLIQSLACCVEDDHLQPMHRSRLDEDSDSDEDDHEMRELTIKFYQCVEQFIEQC